MYKKLKYNYIFNYTVEPDKEFLKREEATDFSTHNNEYDPLHASIQRYTSKARI